MKVSFIITTLLLMASTYGQNQCLDMLKQRANMMAVQQDVENAKEARRLFLESKRLQSDQIDRMIKDLEEELTRLVEKSEGMRIKLESASFLTNKKLLKKQYRATLETSDQLGEQIMELKTIKRVAASAKLQATRVTQVHLEELKGEELAKFYAKHPAHKEMDELNNYKRFALAFSKVFNELDENYNELDNVLVIGTGGTPRFHFIVNMNNDGSCEVKRYHDLNW